MDEQNSFTQQQNSIRDLVGLYSQEFQRIRQMRKSEADHILIPGDPAGAVLTRMVDLVNQIEASYIELRVMMDQGNYQFQGYTEEDHAACTCNTMDVDEFEAFDVTVDPDCPVHGEGA